MVVHLRQAGGLVQLAWRSFRLLTNQRDLCLWNDWSGNPSEPADGRVFLKPQSNLTSLSTSSGAGP
jgi:hypothetical protein